MIRLIKVLFLPCLFYGGMVWINQHNLADINKLRYKVSKSILGATFNVKLDQCEIIWYDILHGRFLCRISAFISAHS